MASLNCSGKCGGWGVGDLVQPFCWGGWVAGSCGLVAGYLSFKDRKRYIIEIYDSCSIMVISIPSGTGLSVEGGRAEAGRERGS